MTSPAPTRALVTGASGFLATPLIDHLLARNYHVVAAVRSLAKADACLAQYTPSSQIKFTIIPDMQADGAYDNAVQDVDVVFHTASPFNFTFEDNERDMLTPARKGALGVLESAVKSESVKRVVFTSSFAAVTSPHLDTRPGHIYTEDDWNPVQWDEAVASKDAHFVYLASKTFAEQAVWEFAKTRKPRFDITCMVPPVILGKALQPYNSMADINQSSRVLHRLLDAPSMPRTPAYVAIDVQDCALAHVLAAESDVAKGKRYLTVGSAFSQPMAARIIARLFPDVAPRLPTLEEGEKEYYGYSSALVENDLGISWTPLESTVRETFQQLLDIEQKTGGV